MTIRSMVAVAGWLTAAAACRGPAASACLEGATQSLVCGVNHRGFEVRRCAMGAWSEPEDCHDPDECANGSSDVLACGLNARGTQTRQCAMGAWSGTDACRDPDQCTDGAPDGLACGLNRRGRQTRLCAAGAWGQPGACSDPDVCVDGAVERIACEGSGTQARSCVTGQWGADGNCVAPPIARIAAPGRRDLVHDPRRGRVYITTSAPGGAVLSYDLATQQFDPPLVSGGSFYGIDLSPDGDQLVVADASTANGLSWVYAIDLVTGMARQVTFRQDGDSGTFSAIFTSNSQILVTTNTSASGGTGMHRLDLTTGVDERIHSFDISRAAMLALSADGTTVGWAEEDFSGGPCGRLDLAAQRFTQGGAGQFVWEIAVDRTGAQLAVPLSNGLELFDRNLHRQAELGTLDLVPVGAAYSPVADEIYLAWAGAAISIAAYRSDGFDKLRDIELTPGLFSPPGFSVTAFVEARMKVSRDGHLLLVTMGDSVVVYPTGL